MDEGVDPTNMCKKLISSMQQEAVLEAVAPPGIKALFADWMGQLEKEVLAFAKKNQEMNSEILARKFNISIESSAFLVGKLREEGKI
ncbi:MAG: hypothetical protein ACOYU4_09120 [Thermodesulfobacteriota bacterium]